MKSDTEFNPAWQKVATMKDMILVVARIYDLLPTVGELLKQQQTAQDADVCALLEDFVAENKKCGERLEKMHALFFIVLGCATHCVLVATTRCWRSKAICR